MTAPIPIRKNPTQQPVYQQTAIPVTRQPQPVSTGPTTPGGFQTQPVGGTLSPSGQERLAAYQSPASRGGIPGITPTPTRPAVAFPGTASGGQPSPYGPGVTQINPNQDLRGTTIAPTAASPYTQAGASAFDAAMASLANQAKYSDKAFQALQGGGASYAPSFSTGTLALKDYTPGADTSKLRGAIGDLTGNLSTAPDRTDLAKQAYGLLLEQQQPVFDQAVRGLGQSTAAFGRMGSGLVNSQLADLGTAFKTSADQQARALATEAAGQTLQDRINALNATQGAFGTLQGADVTGNQVQNQNLLSQAGFNLSRDQAMNAANQAAANTELARIAQIAGLGNSALGAGGLAGNLAGLAFGEGASTRNELRGERGYQNALEDQAFQRALGQVTTEDQLLGNQFNRNLAQGGALGNLGYGSDPTGLLQNQANIYGQQAADAFGGVGDLASQLAFRGSPSPVPNQGYPVSPASSVPVGGLAPGTRYYTSFPTYGQPV